MVVVKVLVYFLLDFLEVFFSIFEVAQAFFSEDAIKAFNEGLFVLLVGSGGSDTRDFFSCEVLPFTFELGATVSLDMVDLSEVGDELSERCFALFCREAWSHEDMCFTGVGVDGGKGVYATKINSVYLQYIPRFGTLFHKPTFGILLPLAAKDEALTEDAVDRGY
mgnify:CR=1 FL=1